MPFLEIDEEKYIPPSLRVKDGQIAGGVPEPEEPEEPNISYWEDVKIKFFDGNSVGGFISNKKSYNTAIDPAFDIEEAFKKVPLHIQASYGFTPFMRSPNQDHFDSVLDQINFEIDNESRKRTGFMGFLAEMNAQFADPVNLIPIGAAANVVAKSAKSVLQYGAKVGMATAGAVSAQELLLHSQQETRTLGESAANVATATLLSSVLGGAGYALFAKSPDFSKTVKRLEKELEYDEWADKIKDSAEDQVGESVGAAVVKKKSREELLDDNTLVRSAVIEPLGSVPIFKTPNLQLSKSPAVSSRLAVQELSDLKFWTFKKNLKGQLERTENVETQINRDKGRAVGANRFLAQNWATYRRRVGKNQNRLLREDFNLEVIRALNNKGKHDIPEISKTAQKYREDVYNHYGKKAVELGIFKDKETFMENMDSYVPQIWDKPKVQRYSKEVQLELARFFKEEYSKAKRGDKVRIYEDAIETLDDSFFDDLAYKTWKNIIGAQSNALQEGIIANGAVKFTKGRKLTIPRERIEQWLVNDPSRLAQQYSSLMSTRIRLAEKFGLGFLDDNAKAAKSFVVQNIKDEYSKLQKKVIDKPKELKKLIAAEEKDLANIFALRDRMLGTYGYSANPDSGLYRFQKQVKQFNVATKLGDVVMSSQSDIGRAVGVEGYTKFLSSQLIPIARLMTSKKGRAYALKRRDELHGFNIGAEVAGNGRFNSLADIMDDFGRHTKLERGLNTIGAKFGQISLMSYHNSFWKEITSNGIMHKVNRALDAFSKGKASAKQKTALSKSGFDETSIKAINKQLKKHGENYKGVIFPNIADWDAGTRDLAELYYGVISSEVNSTIITPGVGSMPLWTSKELLNLTAQFKSFSMASIEKTLIPMIQNFDASQAQGLSAMIMTGALVYMYKQWAAGNEIPTDPKLLVQQGIDRSGVLGYFMDINNAIEHGSSGEYGLSKILGTNHLQKFYHQSDTDTLYNLFGGPTGGTAKDILEVGKAPFNGVNQKTVHAFRKMIPLQNMIGVRQTLDLMEKEFNNTIGIPKN